MSKTLFDNPRSVVEDQLNRLFSKDSEDSTHTLLKIVSIILFQDPLNKDLAAIYKAVGIEDFSKIINLFSGRTITFFTRTEFEDALILALCYYMRDIEGRDWEDIKRTLPFELSPISIGNKISMLNKSIKMNLTDIFTHMKETESDVGQDNKCVD